MRNHFSLNKQEFIAKLSSIKDMAGAFDSLFRGRTFGAAASLQRIPEIQYACEQRLKSIRDR
jgi:hypothetical protein